MAELVSSSVERPGLSASALLRAAAGLWFVTAVIGQLTFVYYIAAFYGRPTVLGHFDAWRRNTNLIKGYVAGDIAGNLYFAVHVLIAAFITTSGALQLVPQIRSRIPVIHKWNGRFYIAAAFLMALGGLWLIWVRGTYLNLYGAASSTVLALLIMGCAAMTLRYALARKFDLHRRWALRTFLVVNGVWFQRIGYMAWLSLMRRPVGIGHNMDGPFDIVWGFGEFLIPLAVLEIYLRVKVRSNPLGQSLMAVLLVILAQVTGIGIVRAYMVMWLPLVGA